MKRSIRVNTRKIATEDFVDLAKKKGWQLEPVLWCPDGFFIERDEQEKAETPLGSTQEHEDGLFYVQEASSMFPPEVVEYREAELILDASCAPGSKLTQIANKARTSLVIGNEPNKQRLKATTTNLERLGIDNVILTGYDVSYFGNILPNTFDKIFLDAPCSNIGRAEVREGTISQNKVKFMAGVQRRLLQSAFRALKPGGTLVYSTCTVTDEENEDNVQKLLKKFPREAKLEEINLQKLIQNSAANQRIERSSHKLPGTVRIEEVDFETDGFYIAKITKVAATPVEMKSRRIFELKKLITSDVEGVSQEDQEKYFVISIFDKRYLISKALAHKFGGVIGKISPKWIGKKIHTPKKTKAEKRAAAQLHAGISSQISEEEEVKSKQLSPEEVAIAEMHRRNTTNIHDEQEDDDLDDGGLDDLDDDDWETVM